MIYYCDNCAGGGEYCGGDCEYGCGGDDDDDCGGGGCNRNGTFMIGTVVVGGMHCTIEYKYISIHLFTKT